MMSQSWMTDGVMIGGIFLGQAWLLMQIFDEEQRNERPIRRHNRTHNVTGAGA
jgi:hypothetical protein